MARTDYGQDSRSTRPTPPPNFAKPEPLEYPEVKPERERIEYVTIPGAGWLERRLADVEYYGSYVPYWADKNKFTRWLFDTRGISLAGNVTPHKYHEADPRNFISVHSDSLGENVTELFANPWTAVLTNTDDFVNSDSEANTALETAAAISPWTRGPSKWVKGLKTAAVADFSKDMYEDNAAGANPDIKPWGDPSDPLLPWTMYDSELRKKGKHPPEAANKLLRGHGPVLPPVRSPYRPARRVKIP